MTTGSPTPVFQVHELAQVGKKLLAWYEENKRVLPWRDRADEDPYAIWVSEIMLQQTTVGAVFARYEPFLKRFPTVQHLAKATEEDVLAELQGMGYYRRFRAMKRAAEFIVDSLEGTLPTDFKTWLALPGIGEYTAGAILSIAYNKAQPAVDGNVVRVLTRLLALPGIHETPVAKRKLGQVVLSMIPKNRASCFNQGLFDLGATICLPSQPLCSECPISSWCKARERNEISLYPEKPKKKKMVDVTVAVLLCRRGEDIFMWRRPKGASRMPGFREMPEMWLDENNADPQSALQAVVSERLGFAVKFGDEVARCKHSITHHKLTCRLFEGQITQKKLTDGEWVNPNNLTDTPTSTITKKLLKQVLRDE
ncbi:MAG: A/G-specific adenine glycosylase [Planctomycetota bacterium]|jgi:A/G-specific adenine glycosylase